MGDFNIDLLQYESNSHTNDFINSVISHSFLPYIHQPTRVTDHSATVIDNIFSNITDFDILSGNITSIIADHFAQFLLIKKCHVSYKSCSYFAHDYSNFGKEKFIHHFSLIDWSILDNTDLSANDHFDYFYHEKTSCTDLRVPKKRITSKVLNLITEPWIDNDIQRLMSYRDKLFNKMVQSPTPSNKYLYSKFRNRVVSEQRKSKIRHFEDYFEKNKTDMKMLWTGIRSIVNVKVKTHFSNISHLLDNGTRVNDPVKMANLFDKYFVNVGSNIDKTIPRTTKSPTDYLKDRISESMFLAPVCPEEIQTIIHSLNTDKSIGPYSIPVFLLKLLSRIISLPLSLIINHSLETGIFPNKMKIGKVTPPTSIKRILLIIHQTIDQYPFYLYFQKSLRN